MGWKKLAQEQEIIIKQLRAEIVLLKAQLAK